jgi:tRNA(Ile)-lysidine synthase
MFLTEQFPKFLFTSCHYQAGEPVLVAVSGGLDSVVLCDLLMKNKIDFAIAHVNFGLRGNESDGDELFVAALAEKLNVPFYLYRCTKDDFDATGENSIQAAARKIRYDFFEKCRLQHGYQKIMTAHHKDDTIETALLNFARGTGLAGLKGIPPSNNSHIVRPLLFATREEIQAYAKANQLEWREDSSNETDNYTRNKFRHHLLPWLREEIPQSYKGFEASFRNIEDAQQLIRAALDNFRAACVVSGSDEINISIKKLIHFVAGEEHLKFFLKEYGFHSLPSDWYHTLLNGEPGTEFISSTHRLIRDRDELFIVSRNNELINPGAFSYFTEEKPEIFPNEKWETVVDSSLISLPLEVRRWKNGDRFIPFGMKGHKNVSDILNEMKLPAHKKEKATVVISRDEIVWVPGYRIANKFRVTEKTSSVIRLKFDPEKYGA